MVDGGLSKHIQLPASDVKTITLAKTEEVRILSAYQIYKKPVLFVNISGFYGKFTVKVTE